MTVKIGPGAGRPVQRDDVALWGNIVLLHLWGAVVYLKPGWFPAIAGVAQLLVLLAMFRVRQLEAKLAQQRRA